MKEIKKLYYKHKRLFIIFFSLCGIALLNLIVTFIFYTTPLSADYHEFGESAPGVTFLVNTLSYILFLSTLPQVLLPINNSTYAYIVFTQFMRTVPLIILTSIITLFIYAFIINTLIKLLDTVFNKLNIKIHKPVLKNIMYFVIIGSIFIGGSIKLFGLLSGGGKAYKSKAALCNDFQQSYIRTIAKTDRIHTYSDKKWKMAMYVESNLYQLCMIELNENALQKFKMGSSEEYLR